MTTTVLILLLFVLLFLIVVVLGIASCHPARRPGRGTLPLEREVWRELNIARTRPDVYADYLRTWPPRFEGRRLFRPGKVTMATEEGRPAVEEAIRFLDEAAPRRGVAWSRGMAHGAADLVADLGPRGAMGHEGNDGTHVGDRVSRYGGWKRRVGEDIQYGSDDPREIIALLIVDDGVRDRGHRESLFEPDYRVGGVAIGPHAVYQTMCVITLAGGYTEGATAPGASP